jgi:hypothetical protein
MLHHDDGDLLVDDGDLLVDDGDLLVEVKVSPPGDLAAPCASVSGSCLSF